jgi:hypothetical protein
LISLMIDSIIWEDRKEKAVMQVVQHRVPAAAHGYERRHGENPNLINTTDNFGGKTCKN